MKTGFLMKLDLLLLSTVAYFLILPTISFSAQLGIFYAEGSKPSRVVYLTELYHADERTIGMTTTPTRDEFQKIQEEQKSVKMRILAIYENKMAPESIDMTLELQCHEDVYRISEAHAILRNGTEKRTNQNWQSYPTKNAALLLKAEKFLCNHNYQFNSINKISKVQDASVFEKLGVIYLGDLDRFKAVHIVKNTIFSKENDIHK